jgi:hypothetical protein
MISGFTSVMDHRHRDLIPLGDVSPPEHLHGGFHTVVLVPHGVRLHQGVHDQEVIRAVIKHAFKLAEQVAATWLYAIQSEVMDLPVFRDPHRDHMLGHDGPVGLVVHT